MNAKELIARRVALEIKSGTLVNLGIGLPTWVANFIPEGVSVTLDSENGLVGMGGKPPSGLENWNLTDAGASPVTALPGAAAFDSSVSFGLIRGGHLDVTVLGGLQVDSEGHLANWMVPGKMVPGMGGAMDLLNGARRVIIAMQHTAQGAPKIVKKCTFPLTSIRVVDLIVTELAVIQPSAAGLVLLEYAPGVSVADIRQATEAPLIVSENVREMKLVQNEVPVV
ncbi:MAG: 3-oxoacid CoA-transferase subunit B [Oligoflexia bacterium]|nr:3-oxoacid CoA-transferase subunit B [Oligoflexia bacterium]